MSLIRKYIRLVLENEYKWNVASDKSMMLDEPGMETSDKEDQEQYLKNIRLMEDNQSSSAILIPPPPSEEYRVSELSLVRDQYNNRKNTEELQSMLDEDIPTIFNSIVKSAGYPCMMNTLAEVSKSLVPIISQHKQHFRSERPTELASKVGFSFVGDHLDSAQTPSYPSGHTTQAFYLASFLSDIYPELEESLYTLAQMIADSRIDRGVHFPSDNEAGKILAKSLYHSTKNETNLGVNESKSVKVRGYLKPDASFFTLDEWKAAVEMLLDLQEEGIDVRGQRHPDPRLNSILERYFGYQLNVEVSRWELLTEKNVLDFIEDFVNHRFWGIKKEFGEYFPDINKLRFAYFYSRGDMEPYVLLDEEYTEQLYGSLNNKKTLMHYTTTKGIKRISDAIESGEVFDISTFTVAERPFFRPESNLILKIEGNVRAGFRSDIKSMAVDTGRRACNMYRLEYPGEDLNNICYELETCDGDVRTSLWNEYIATPIKILEVMEVRI